MYFNWTDPNKMRNILSRHQTHPHHFHRAASLREAQGPPPRIANQSPASTQVFIYIYTRQIHSMYMLLSDSLFLRCVLHLTFLEMCS